MSAETERCLCGETMTAFKGMNPGELCVCSKDYRHVFSDDHQDHWHECECAAHTTWMDDQQWAEAQDKRRQAGR